METYETPLDPPLDSIKYVKLRVWQSSSIDMRDFGILEYRKYQLWKPFRTTVSMAPLGHRKFQMLIGWSKQVSILPKKW